MSLNEQLKKDPIIFHTRLRFLLAFVFLAILTFGTFIILLNQVDQAEDDALVVSVMENQYGFVNKATFLASSYAQSNDFKERQELRKSVHEALSVIIAFTDGNRDKPSFKTVIPDSVRDRIYNLYLLPPSKLNEEMLDYIESLKSFLMGSPVHMSSDNPKLRTLQTKTLRVLSFLRTAVKQNQKESWTKIQFLKSLGIFFFVLTIVYLFFVGFSIFLPTLRRLRSYLSQIHGINEALEKKVKERTAELEQKATELETSNRQLFEQIQERLRIEDELKRVNVFLDSIIENIPAMIFIKDAEELRFVRFNRAGETLLGFSRNELLSKNDHDFFPKEQADFFLKKDRETLAQKDIVEIFEEPINTKHKGIRILHTKKIPVMDNNGKPAYLLGISEDITEKIQSEKQVRELTLAMENALDGIARLDMNLKYLNVNKAYAAMMGYTPQEMAGLNHMVTVCTENHDKVREIFEEMKETGKAEAEIRAARKDGTIFYQYVVIVKSLDKDKNFDGFYCFAKDVTERKYRESIEIKSDLIQMVSHELRTPIHSVKEGLSIVLEGLTGQLGTEQKEVLEIAKRCADRLSRLVNDVLAFHKLEAGVIEFNFKKTNLNELIGDAADAMQPSAEDKGLRLELSLQKDLPEVELDYDKIIQVLTNFLQNAIKFTPQGAITISSSLTGQDVKVSVKDTGIGIQQKDIAKIFRKFGQLEAAKSIAPGGAGLGLAISKKIVERHHGTVDLESEYKRGSIFSFTLPVAQPPADHSQKRQSAPVDIL